NHRRRVTTMLSVMIGPPVVERSFPREHRRYKAPVDGTAVLGTTRRTLSAPPPRGAQVPNGQAGRARQRRGGPETTPRGLRWTPRSTSRGNERAGQRAMKHFHAFRLDPVNQRLWRGDERVTLAPKAFDVLSYLVQHADRLVTHEEILEALWPDTHVNPEV